MFELSIAKKYLVPKRKQLSVSLIAIMSVTVISLVVWLVLVFLSVTEGIQRSWLEKLTSLNSPLRITPTEKYYSSYYYQVDALSSESGYSLKTIGQKQTTSTSADPYDPESDMEMPRCFPKPDRLQDGSLKDPVKTLFHILAKENLVAEEYELTGALMRLQLVRTSSLGEGMQSFLTQVAYVASPPLANPSLPSLIQPPNPRDLNHLFYLAKHNQISPLIDAPQMTPLANADELAKKLSHLLPYVKMKDQGKEKMWDGQEMDDLEVQTAFEEAPKIPPPWAYTVKGRLHLPPNGILLAKNFQDSGVKIGDSGYFSFAASTGAAMQEQRQPLYVAGFYDPGIVPVGNKCVFVDASIVRAINASNVALPLDKTLSNGIQVWLKDLNDAEPIKTKLQKAFVEAGIAPYWKISTFKEYDFAKDLFQQFESDKMLFMLVGVIILIVACCNIISLLVLLVNDKKKEIGILQAMGASPKSIAAIFGLCGILMGIISSVLGVMAALITLYHIDTVAAVLSFFQGYDAFNALFYGKSLPNHLSQSAVLFVLVATPILSLLAGLIPAIKACRLRPSEILRSE